MSPNRNSLISPGLKLWLSETVNATVRRSWSRRGTVARLVSYTLAPVRFHDQRTKSELAVVSLWSTRPSICVLYCDCSPTPRQFCWKLSAAPEFGTGKNRSCTFCDTELRRDVGIRLPGKATPVSGSRTVVRGRSEEKSPARNATVGT